MASFKPGLGGQAFKWGMHFRQRLMVGSVQGAELGGWERSGGRRRE